MVQRALVISLIASALTLLMGWIVTFLLILAAVLVTLVEGE